MSLAFWICVVVTIASAGTSLGFSIAALRTTEAVALTNARYALARSIALFVLALVPLAVQSVEWAAAGALAMVLVQLGDTIVGVTIRDRIKTFGPLGTAVVGLAALVWLLAS